MYKKDSLGRDKDTLERRKKKTYGFFNNLGRNNGVSKPKQHQWEINKKNDFEQTVF